MRESFPGRLCRKVKEPLWQPSRQRIAEANLTAFMAAVREEWGVALSDYAALYDWSIREKERFWHSLWSFSEVRAEKRGDVILEVDKQSIANVGAFEKALTGSGSGTLLLVRRGENTLFMAMQRPEGEQDE